MKNEKKPNKNKVDASIFLLVSIILLLGGGIFFLILLLRSDPIEEAVNSNQVINTLFVLEDNGTPRSSYVLVYYPATTRAAIFDIPNDLGLILQKINRVDSIETVYNAQDLRDYENEIASLLGITISFSIIIETERLGKLVDLIEGVELFIPSPVQIINAQEMILFQPGLSRLDGDKAKQYENYEVPEEDRELAVFRRQRFFLSLIKRIGEQKDYLKNPVIQPLFLSLLETGMGQRVQGRLFDEFARLDTERINIQSVSGNPRVVSGKTLIFPLYNGNLIKDIVRQALVALQVEGSNTDRVYTVEVLNGTQNNGLAGRTAELLRGFGYDVISIGNADTNQYEKTLIINRSGLRDVVLSLSEVIQCNNIRFEEAVTDTANTQKDEYRSDFTVIIGRDFNGRYVSGD